MGRREHVIIVRRLTRGSFVDISTVRIVMAEIASADLGRGQEQRDRLRTVTAFIIFGTLNLGIYLLVIAGAQDILAGTFVQTSVVLVANTTPTFLVTLIAPYFMQKIPYFARISVLCFSAICGFLMLAFAKQLLWKLTGVGLVSFANGVGDVTFMPLTSFYDEACLTAYSAGTGVGIAVAPLYYTGRSDMCVFLKLFAYCLLPCEHTTTTEHMQPTATADLCGHWTMPGVPNRTVR